MKHIYQLTWIMAFTFGAEFIVKTLKIPLPGSILGMLLLFAALKSGLVSISKVEETGNFLLSILPLMFVPLGVGIIKYLDIIQSNGLAIAVIIGLTTLLVMAVTGWVVQVIKKKEGKYHAL